VSLDMRERGSLGGRSSAGLASLLARERCRTAALDGVQSIDHTHAREAIHTYLRQGLLDAWVDAIYRRGDLNGYARAHHRAQRGDDKPVQPGASLYGRQKARARRWMAEQVGEFTSRDLAAGIGIATDLAATYVSRAYADGLLLRREEPRKALTCRRFYTWKAQ
jgi:hypothetical protein